MSKKGSKKAPATSKAEVCDTCGKPVPPGAWPFCESKRNPQGHSTNVQYGWKFGRGQNTARNEAFFQEKANNPFGTVDGTYA